MIVLLMSRRLESNGLSATAARHASGPPAMTPELSAGKGETFRNVIILLSRAGEEAFTDQGGDDGDTFGFGEAARQVGCGERVRTCGGEAHGGALLALESHGLAVEVQFDGVGGGVGVG